MFALFKAAQHYFMSNIGPIQTDLVCLAKLLEALVRLLVAPVFVGMQLAGQHVVCPLNFLRRGILQERCAHE